MKSKFLVLIFSLAMIFLCTPVFAENMKTQAQEKVLKEIDLQKAFGEVDGCAVFYSTKYDVYYVYNSQLLEIREIPCSTFKIISALAGLENKVIQDEHTVRRWDGIQRDFPLWNQDLSLASAIQLSATWYFDEVVEEVGMDKLSAIVKQMQYGNMDVSGGVQLWGTTLKISPFEQITFIEKLFNNQLPFEQKNMDIVKKAMYINTEKGKLYGKTGTSGTQALENGKQTAWFVGDYQTNADEYYFAVRIYGNKDRKDIAGGTAQSITQKILKEYFAN